MASVEICSNRLLAHACCVQLKQGHKLKTQCERWVLLKAPAIQLQCRRFTRRRHQPIRMRHPERTVCKKDTARSFSNQAVLVCDCSTSYCVRKAKSLAVQKVVRM